MPTAPSRSCAPPGTQAREDRGYRATPSETSERLAERSTPYVRLCQPPSSACWPRSQHPPYHSRRPPPSRKSRRRIRVAGPLSK
jgi:hypothetical protein